MFIRPQASHIISIIEDILADQPQAATASEPSGNLPIIHEKVQHSLATSHSEYTDDGDDCNTVIPSREEMMQLIKVKYKHTTKSRASTLQQ